MRKAYIIYKRQKGDRRVYQIAFWVEERRSYAIRRSADKLIRELGEKARHLTPTTKAGADAAARLALEDGLPERDRSGWLGYLKTFWGEGSSYLQGKEVRKKPLSATYVKNHRSAIEHYIAPFLELQGWAGLPLHRVTPSHIEALVLHLADRGLGSSRINGILKAVRVPFSKAWKENHIRANPCRLVEELPEPPPPRLLLNDQEVKSFFSKPWEDLRLLVANMVAASTGLRLGEIRGLQAEDLDVRPGYIHVCHNWQDAEPKGRKLKGPKHSTLIHIRVRDVPLPSKTEVKLRELASSNPWKDGFVFYGFEPGKPLSATTIEGGYYKALAAIGIDRPERERRNLTFHSWRHWYRSQLDELGLSARAGDELTGHESEQIGKRYTHITDAQRAAVLRIGEKLG